MYLEREQYVQQNPHLRQGLTVYSQDGEKLGDISELCGDYFVIEKGFFFPKHFTARYDDLVRVDGDRVLLRLSKDQLTPWQSDSFAGWQQYDQSRGDTSRADWGSEKSASDRRKMVHTELKYWSSPGIMGIEEDMEIDREREQDAEQYRRDRTPKAS